MVAALLERGRVTAAASLVDPLVAGRDIDAASWTLSEARALVDVTRGRLDEADAVLHALLAVRLGRGIEARVDRSLLQAEAALWQARPEAALSVVEQMLPALGEHPETYLAARLLVLGMRSCADLVQHATARCEQDAVAEARRRADGLRRFADRTPADPFDLPETDGQWATWRAESARCRAERADRLWEAAAARWDAIGRPHRAAYARWRQAEQLLDAGRRTPATAVLQQAWRQAGEHVPLRRAIADLARLARIALEPTTETSVPEAPASSRPFDLTARELDVLRLLTRGLTNSQIGAELYISPKTASVHVTAILRKLGATNRVQAAAMAERGGLSGQERDR